jgi:hypothetical protein
MCAGVAAFPPEAARMSSRRARRRSDGTADPVFREMPRHLLPLPPERREQQPFVYDPVNGRIVAPWPRGPLSLADARRLDAALDRIALVDADIPVWLWPDDRPPIPVEAGSLHQWLAHWARGSGVLRRRAGRLMHRSPASH